MKYLHDLYQQGHEEASLTTVWNQRKGADEGAG